MKYTSMLVIITTLVMILSGCDGTTDTKEQSNKLSGEITFLASSGSFEIWDRVKQQFENKYPNTKIHLLFQSGAYLKQLQALVDKGEMPDVFQGSSSIFREFNSKGLIKDLSLLAKTNGEYLNEYFEDSLLKFSTENGKVVSIPTYLAAPKLLYSKLFFQKAGIPEPTKDLTWQGFADISRTIKDKNENNQYSVLFPMQLNLLSSLVLSNSGSFTPDGKLYQGYMDEKRASKPFNGMPNWRMTG